MKLSSIKSIQPSYYDKSYTDRLKFIILKTTEHYTHSSQLDKNLYPMTLEGDTLLQLNKW